MTAIKIGNDGLYYNDETETLYLQDDFGNLIAFSRDMAVQRKFTLL